MFFSEYSGVNISIYRGSNVSDLPFLVEFSMIAQLIRSNLMYPVNPESGIIPSGQLDYSNFEYSNIPGKELNVNDITEQQFL